MVLPRNRRQHFPNRIIDDGNFGMHHNDMCMLYLQCSSAAIHLDDSEGALKSTHGTASQ